MVKTLRWLGVVAILCLPGALGAQTGPEELNELLTVTGQVAGDEKAARQIGYDAISIGFTGQAADRRVWIGVVTARAWDGDAFRGKEILDGLDPYNPSLIAAGKAAVLAKLQQAPVGSRIVIEGLIDPSARLYQVGSVKTTPPGAAK
jgi:hypothetical protein